MEKKNKAFTFIGFAIKTGKYRIGLNAIETLKRANLMIVCKTISENSKEKAIKQAKKFNCPIVTTVNSSLEQITFKQNAKAMAIYDGKLAKAILENLEQEFNRLNLEK